MPRCHPYDSPRIESATSQAVVVRQPLQVQHQPPSGRGPNLLDLPIEVRLMIYGYVLGSNTYFSSDNRPPKIKSSKVQTICACTCIASRPRIMTESRRNDDHIRIIQQDTDDSPKSPMFSPRRPQGYIPTGLLGACRQIHAEIRTLPFNLNDWAFASTTVKDSGLVAASFFTRALVPWQRDAMRWARVNVSWGDFDNTDRLAQWEELCGFWGAGLRGLRLHVGDGSIVSMHRKSVWRESALENGDQWRWVDGGLRRLRQLRTLEVEWTGRQLPRISREQKLRWCERVSERLNEGRDEGDRAAVVAIA